MFANSKSRWARVRYDVFARVKIEKIGCFELDLDCLAPIDHGKERASREEERDEEGWRDEEEIFQLYLPREAIQNAPEDVPLCLCNSRWQHGLY